MNLVRAELLKLRIARFWWILAAALVLLWAFAFASSWDSTDSEISSLRSYSQVLESYSRDAFRSLYTSGWPFSLLLVLLLGAGLMPSEFSEKTATATFLATPRRHRVVLAKLAVSALVGLITWAAVTGMNVATGAILLARIDVPAQLDDSALVRTLTSVRGGATGLSSWSQTGRPDGQRSRTA